MKDAGRQSLKKLESHFSAFHFIYTGALGNEEESIEGIEVFRKRDASYSDLFDEFWDTYETGLTRIMGGEGKIEDLLGKVFLENLLLQRKKWVLMGKQIYNEPKMLFLDTP